MFDFEDLIYVLYVHFFVVFWYGGFENAAAILKNWGQNASSSWHGGVSQIYPKSALCTARDKRTGMTCISWYDFKVFWPSKNTSQTHARSLGF